jgi:hypothetical protein
MTSFGAKPSLKSLIESRLPRSEGVPDYSVLCEKGSTRMTQHNPSDKDVVDPRDQRLMESVVSAEVSRSVGSRPIPPTTVSASIEAKRRSEL